VIINNIDDLAKIIEIAKQNGIDLCYDNISRDELYHFDEIFLTGTASEIVPVGFIDHRIIGDGDIGPITREIQQHFENIVRGKNQDKRNWLTIIQ
jgi:branched-chain amino acid aminotransferase